MFKNVKLHCGYHVNGDIAFCIPHREWQCYDLVIARMNLHCLNSLHFLLTRQKRLAEWKATQIKNCFGEVVEISGQDYIKEVNKAGEGIWVVLHLYKQGWVFCHSLPPLSLSKDCNSSWAHQFMLSKSDVWFLTRSNKPEYCENIDDQDLIWKSWLKVFI